MSTAQEMLEDLRISHTITQLSKALKISTSSLHRYIRGMPVKNENIYEAIKKYWENPNE
jgi:response regulator of citrate/malate metabolism